MHRHCLIFFMDGVGLGGDDPAVNPFVTAHLPALTKLLGEDWYLQGRELIQTDRASLIPTDATLNMPELPQSATGQATILTGKNVPRLVGKHHGPRPNQAVIEVIQQGTLFSEVVAMGQQAGLLTPYPQPFFEAIESGKRKLSAVPLAVQLAGLPLRTADALQNGTAVSPGFTNEAWREQLGYMEMPLLTLHQAGQRIAHLAQNHQFTFFEHWPTDHTGHWGKLEKAREHLELVDGALAGLFEAWDDENGLLIITSDHGNIEEKNHRRHSFNPVPTILLGKNHQAYASQIQDLTHIAPIVRDFLGIDHS